RWIWRRCCRPARPGGRCGGPGSSPPVASRTRSRGPRAPPAPRPPPSRRDHRRRRWRSRQGHLLGLGEDQLVAALKTGAGLALGLVHLLLHADPAALGTGVRHRLVPGGEVARRVADATPERLAALG